LVRLGFSLPLQSEHLRGASIYEKMREEYKRIVFFYRNGVEVPFPGGKSAYTLHAGRNKHEDHPARPWVSILLRHKVQYPVHPCKNMSLLSGLLVLILVIIIVILLFRLLKSVAGLIINAIVGIILLWLINLFNLMSLAGRPDIPINLITILISAIGGIIGVAIIVLLHLLGINLGL
jgi:hypothetical protein